MNHDMSKSTDITCRSAAVWFLPVHTRMPLKFGGETVTYVTCARAKAEGCPMVISLVNDPSLLSLLGPLGIDAYLNPRATTVSSILRHIRHGKVRQVYSIGDAEAELIEAHRKSK